MVEVDKNNETSSVFCCCFKKSAELKPSYSKISYSQLQETLKVPYSANIPKDLGAGSVICITGSIKSKCTRFAIDLICKKETHTDIAFHFNPRLDRHYVVRNSCIGERWGVEEAASTTKCELHRNEKFEIIYLITNDSFMVSVNGKHFCAFRFRLPLCLVTHIEVLGEVDIFDVEYKTTNLYPELKNDTKPLIIDVGEVQEQLNELLAIPCTGHLPQGFQENWQLEVYGRVKLLPHSFYINLQEGAQMWPHPNIPLHLNPRFRSVAGENVIVRNAWLDGRWGAEERPPGFPFSPGSSFCVAIRRTSDCFAVWINGQLAGEFRFRIASDKIDTLYIQGDITLKKIVLHNKFVELQKPEPELIKL